jgi:PilZ domain
MSNERRIAPRKAFSIPVRIRPMATESVTVAAGGGMRPKNVMTSGPVQKAAAGPVKVVDMLDGETVNLSERGVYFRSAQKVKIGQSVELYFTLPCELTGRSPEPVKCSARVVHVEREADDKGWLGVGASVERFEPLQRFRWGN